MNVENRIVLDKFVARPYQKEIIDALDKGYKKLVVVLPRRAGKDITCWNIAIRQCISKVCLVQYILPTFGQARRCIFQAIDIDGNKFMDYIPSGLVDKINSSEQKIIFKNGSILQCLGGDTHDTSIRGTNPFMVILSEFAYMQQDVYNTVRPILACNGGVVIFLSTPYGKNHFYHLFQIAKELPDWYVLHKKTSDIKHISAEALEQERQQMSPELYEQEYECFPAGAGVLTPDGISSIQDIRVGELVISHSGRPRTVLSTMRKKYNGEMIVINSRGSCEDIVCTPEHPIRIYNKTDQSYSWIMAKDIKKDFMVVFPKYQLSSKPIISFDLCMLIAWYITEGSGSKNYVQFCLGNKGEVSRVCEYLNRLDFDYSVYESTGWQVVVNCTNLLDFLKVNCGSIAENKRIPFSLISGYEKQFFYELMLGDGCKNEFNGREKYSYTTISRSLAYQVQFLANSLDENFAAGITIKEPSSSVIQGRMVKNKRSYLVQISIAKHSKNNSPWFFRGKYSIAARVMSVSKINYDDYVYNLSVQFDKSYVVAGRSVHNCNFNRGVDGSYFGRNLQDLRSRGQITSVNWEPGLLVHVSMDIGVKDATTLIWFQVVGDGTVIRIIDCYSNTGLGLDHYAHVLQSKPYRYGKYFAPHDLAVREWGGGAITRYEKARQLDINFTILEQISVADGIENVWTHFPKFWIDADKCKSLIDALENYRREFDEKNNVYKNKPIHNWASNYADALRYLCQSLHKTKKGLTGEEFDRKRAEAIYGPGKFRQQIFNHDPRFDR